MRRAEKEITDPQLIDAIMRSATVCRLGLCRDGQPYVVPMNFGAKGRTVYFHAAGAGLKLDMLRANPRVCVEFTTDAELITAGTASGFSMRYRSVIGFGRVVFLDDLAAKRHALTVLLAHYTDAPLAIPDMAVAKTTVFQVELDAVTGKQNGY